MGRVIVIQYITIDGVVEDPDGRAGAPFGGWAMRYGPQGIAGDKFQLGSILETGVLLFGRRTWDHFSQLWPNRTDPFSASMNAATKAVATSHPIDEATWSNSSTVPGELEAWVRQTLVERDVVVIGSGTIVDRLAADDLVDEYRLITFPIAVGAGRTLFPTGIKLELTGSSPVGPGILAYYAIEGRTGR
jgi:dihydrofolate reductase